MGCCGYLVSLWAGDLRWLFPVGWKHELKLRRLRGGLCLRIKAHLGQLAASAVVEVDKVKEQISQKEGPGDKPKHLYKNGKNVKILVELGIIANNCLHFF